MSVGLARPPCLPGLSGGQLRGVEGSLPVVGWAALSLQPSRLVEGVDEVLELIRSALRADAAELFLADPAGSEMILVACRGSPLGAFTQRLRFPRGEGYPGLVLAEGQPLLTRELPRDRRYLRDRVKESGFRSYVCLPVLDGDEVLGVLNAAWRRRAVPLERALRLLQQLASPVGAAVQAFFYRLCRDREPADSPGGLSSLVSRARALTGAQEARAVLLPEAGAPLLAATGSARPEECPGLRSGRCPCLSAGIPVLLPGSAAIPQLDTGPSGAWPDPCRPRASDRAGLCVPLGSCGVLSLSYPRDAAPAVLTRDLPALLVLGRQEPPRGREVSSPRPALEVRCFGRFEIRLEGREVPGDRFRRKKALALLKLLILAEGRPVSREVLCEKLWPEAEEEAALNRLHGVVHALREGIEPPFPRPRWRYVQTAAGGYLLERSALSEVDLWCFRRLLSEARRCTGLEKLRRLEQACALYRGDLFEDDPYAEWCWVEREQCRQSYLEALRTLAGIWLARGHLERALSCYRRALEVDDLREDVHQGLIRCLLGLGRREEALRAYRECEARLRRELDAEPLPETRRLLAWIRQSLGRPG